MNKCSFVWLTWDGSDNERIGVDTPLESSLIDEPRIEDGDLSSVR